MTFEKGSDERHTGIDLPIATFCKTRFGDYPEYHTSDDNLNIVSEKGLEESFNVIKDIVDALEIGVKPVSEIYYELNFGKRNYQRLMAESITIILN